MKYDLISLVGLGKLGLPLLCTFAKNNQKIIGVDTDHKKTDDIKNKILPFFEPQLQDYLNEGFNNIEVYSDCKEIVKNTDVAIILVNTPSNKSGEFSNEYIINAIDIISKELKTSQKNDFLFILSSTVMPQSCSYIIKRIEAISGRKLNKGFGFAYVPDLVALGSVVKDFENPDLLILGESEKRYGDIVRSVYAKIIKNNAPVVRMSLIEAEITKISLNAYVTMKISFANFIGNICDALHCSHASVTNALGYDKRISHHYMKSGPAFGGACFPRDTGAFINFSESVGLNAQHIKATQSINEIQNKILFNKVKKFKDKKIGIIGLSFKPNTAFTLGSPGQILFDKLTSLSYNVQAFDPLVLNSKNLKKFVGSADIVVVTHNNKNLLKNINFEKKIVIDPWGVTNNKSL